MGWHQMAPESGHHPLSTCSWGLSGSGMPTSDLGGPWTQGCALTLQRGGSWRLCRVLRMASPPLSGPLLFKSPKCCLRPRALQTGETRHSAGPWVAPAVSETVLVFSSLGFIPSLSLNRPTTILHSSLGLGGITEVKASFEVPCE